MILSNRVYSTQAIAAINSMLSAILDFIVVMTVFIIHLVSQHQCKFILFTYIFLFLLHLVHQRFCTRMFGSPETRRALGCTEITIFLYVCLLFAQYSSYWTHILALYVICFCLIILKEYLAFRTYKISFKTKKFKKGEKLRVQKHVVDYSKSIVVLYPDTSLFVKTKEISYIIPKSGFERSNQL